MVWVMLPAVRGLRGPELAGYFIVVGGRFDRVLGLWYGVEQSSPSLGVFGTPSWRGIYVGGVWLV